MVLHLAVVDLLGRDALPLLRAGFRLALGSGILLDLGGSFGLDLRSGILLDLGGSFGLDLRSGILLHLGGSFGLDLRSGILLDLRGSFGLDLRSGILLDLRGSFRLQVVVATADGHGVGRRVGDGGDRHGRAVVAVGEAGAGTQGGQSRDRRRHQYGALELMHETTPS
ncbi:hypothetical protein [Streptomyces longwoodensis]|uniref:hypothetical protein n=1 Tax=Streptomyces longwoodensis TaxID=68231 RepID=UPI0033D3C309